MWYVSTTMNETLVGRQRLDVADPETENGRGGLLSIVIPTLSEGRLLGGLLTTLRSQPTTAFGIEIIVSDGGSTDETAAVAAEMADTFVSWTGPGKQTIGRGRNDGAAVSRGDVLLFLNADVSLPDSTGRLIADLYREASVHGAATCRVIVDPAEATVADRFVLGACNLLFHGLNVVGLGMGRGECQAVRRDVFMSVGGYRSELVAGEDFDLFRRAASHLRKGQGRVRFLRSWSVYEDPRRYRAQGYLKTMGQWFANFLSVLVRGQSVSRAWEAVR